MLRRMQFELPSNQAITTLDCGNTFNDLTEEEKFYAHYMSRAAWHGALISLAQTSPESPLIFSMLHRIFSAESIESLQRKASYACSCDDDFKAFLIYACAIFDNAGNYCSWDNTKFIPNLKASTFESIVCLSTAYQQDPHVPELLNQTLRAIFLLSKRNERLGFAPEGIGTFWSENCTTNDNELVNEFLNAQKFEPWMSRTFKLQSSADASSQAQETIYDLNLASVMSGDALNITLKDTSFNNCKFRITRGCFSKLLALVNADISNAMHHASCEIDKKILEHYIDAFREGSVEQHKEASRIWVKSKDSTIKTYIGFIHPNRDPAGKRGQFEGIVAMINRKTNAKYAELEACGKTIVKYLPWPPEYENENFISTDLNSLIVLTKAGVSVDDSALLPPYKDIRNDDGLKRFVLLNVMSKITMQDLLRFLCDADLELIRRFHSKAYEIYYAISEIFGRNTGKIFRQDETGHYNFKILTVKNLITGSRIDSWYSAHETFKSKFGDLFDVYNACRCEAVALYLCLRLEILKMFGLRTRNNQDDCIYTIWLSCAQIGATSALLDYDPKTKQWKNYESQALFILMRIFLEAGEGMLKVNLLDFDNDIQISLDRTKIATRGKAAVGLFLQKLQVYKSTGDVTAAEQLIDQYSKLNDNDTFPWKKLRNVCVRRKKPHTNFVQCNTIIENDTVILKHYEPTAEDYIQSILDRYPSTDIDDILEEVAENDKKYFPDAYSLCGYH